MQKTQSKKLQKTQSKNLQSKENKILRNKKNTYNKMCILEKDTCGTESILGTTPQSTLNNKSVVFKFDLMLK